MYRPIVSAFTFCAAIACLLIAGQGQAATISSLSDNFTPGVIDGAKWANVATDFEAGAGTYTADQTTNPGQLTIAGINNISSFWGGRMLRSVDTFDSSKVTAISVDRVSMTGSGSAWRSALWIRQTDGTHFMFSHNVGEGGWQVNNNAAGTGANIGSLDPFDGDGGLHRMQLVYAPGGGSSGTVYTLFDGNVVGTNGVGSWENGTDFNIRVAALARAAATDTVNAVFDNFNAVSSNAVGATSTTGFTVSSLDLIQGMTAAVVGNVNPEEGQTTNNTGALTNGAFGAPGLPGGANVNEVVAIHNNTSLTYTLPFQAKGYRIDSIETYSGWRDPGRDDQDYVVLAEFVNNPGVFLPISGAAFRPGNFGSPSDTKVTITSVAGGPLADGVSAIRFSFGNTENGYVGYREFDVFGQANTIPEPTTAALGLLGLSLLASRRRRAA